MDITAVGSLAGVASAHSGVTPAASPVAEDQRALIHAVKAVNAAELFGQQNELSFAFERKTRQVIVRIVDRKTREVVQQIPTQQVLRLAEELQQRA